MKEKSSQEGITIKKDENFSEWYQQLILKAGLADYSSVSGCIVFKPESYQIWEKIVAECNKEFKKVRIKNCYFPLFIPEKAFEKEKEHVKGFVPEVAWVTHAGNTKLNEKLAVRPTSEAIMYESYSKWIRSWRDLPLRYNQWNNVVRWEFNNPVPFFRTREFLWNEGHSVFATEKEALEEGKQIRKIYEKVVEEFMALPGIYGRKTEKEKFAGAIFSEKLHYIIPNGRVIEGPCFHHDGQNFAKSYNIKFLDKNGKEQYAWQNTYAISTRMLGTMFVVHSDDKGLIVPPKLAENKIVIVPILFDKTKEKILKIAEKIRKELETLSPILDDREDSTPGRKFSEWELKGIPIRIEIGPKDLEKNSVTIAKRNDGKKIIVKISMIKKEIPKLLEQIQKELYKNAEKILKSSIEKTEDKKQLIKFIKEKKMVLVPMCSSEKCEDILKEETGGAKTLFIDPENTSIKNKRCIICNKPADYWVYVGKTY
ncbi:proline--tRNA ligase [Candidatus Pacearchaeota archaeon]|nr:proline--tRNA ligase [Candidatus Pacearchaeota archaeon]